MAQQPPAPSKKHVALRTVGIIVAGLIVLGVVLAVGTHSNGNVTAASSAAASPPAFSAAPAAQPSASPSPTQNTVGNVGDSFTVTTGSGDKYTVTMTKLVDPASGADQFTNPNNGFRFIAAVFTVAATSGSIESEDANSDASVVGSDSQTYTADFSSIAGYTNFNSGEISIVQGQSVTGAVTFQVPVGVKVDRVEWQPDPFGQAATWNVDQG